MERKRRTTSSIDSNCPTENAETVGKSSGLFRRSPPQPVESRKSRSGRHEGTKSEFDVPLFPTPPAHPHSQQQSTQRQSSTKQGLMNGVIPQLLRSSATVHKDTPVMKQLRQHSRVIPSRVDVVQMPKKAASKNSTVMNPAVPNPPPRGPVVIMSSSSLSQYSDTTGSSFSQFRQPKVEDTAMDSWLRNSVHNINNARRFENLRKLQSRRDKDTKQRQTVGNPLSVPMAPDPSSLTSRSSAHHERPTRNSSVRDSTSRQGLVAHENTESKQASPVPKNIQRDVNYYVPHHKSSRSNRNQSHDIPHGRLLERHYIPIEPALSTTSAQSTTSNFYVPGCSQQTQQVAMGTEEFSRMIGETDFNRQPSEVRTYDFLPEADIQTECIESTHPPYSATSANMSNSFSVSSVRSQVLPLIPPIPDFAHSITRPTELTTGGISARSSSHKHLISPNPAANSSFILKDKSRSEYTLLSRDHSSTTGPYRPNASPSTNEFRPSNEHHRLLVSSARLSGPPILRSRIPLSPRGPIEHSFHSPSLSNLQTLRTWVQYPDQNELSINGEGVELKRPQNIPHSLQQNIPQNASQHKNQQEPSSTWLQDIASEVVTRDSTKMSTVLQPITPRLNNDASDDLVDRKKEIGYEPSTMSPSIAPSPLALTYVDRIAKRVSSTSNISSTNIVASRAVRDAIDTKSHSFEDPSGLLVKVIEQQECPVHGCNSDNASRGWASPDISTGISCGNTADKSLRREGHKNEVSEADDTDVTSRLKEKKNGIAALKLENQILSKQLQLEQCRVQQLEKVVECQGRTIRETEPKSFKDSHRRMIELETKLRTSSRELNRCRKTIDEQLAEKRRALYDIGVLKDEVKTQKEKLKQLMRIEQEREVKEQEIDKRQDHTTTRVPSFSSLSSFFPPDQSRCSNNIQKFNNYNGSNLTDSQIHSERSTDSSDDSRSTEPAISAQSSTLNSVIQNSSANLIPLGGGSSPLDDVSTPLSTDPIVNQISLSAGNPMMPQF